MHWWMGYGINALLLAWVIWWGGAERLEGSFLAGLLDHFAIGWTAGGIRLYAWLWLIVSTLGFVIGVFVPGLR